MPIFLCPPKPQFTPLSLFLLSHEVPVGPLPSLASIPHPKTYQVFIKQNLVNAQINQRIQSLAIISAIFFMYRKKIHKKIIMMNGQRFCMWALFSTYDSSMIFKPKNYTIN